MQILVRFPPPKVHSVIKGTSFIESATHQHTVVKLDTSPTLRRVQVKIVEQVVKSLGAVKQPPYWIAFQRVGNRVETTIGMLDTIPAPDAASPVTQFWFQTPPLLRVYLAIAHLFAPPSGKPTPRDVTDLAHLPWLLREKGGVAPWKWGFNGSKPTTHAPVDVGDLTPVFAGATLWVVGSCRIRLRKGA